MYGRWPDFWKALAKIFLLDKRFSRGHTEREINERFIKYNVDGERHVTNEQREIIEQELLRRDEHTPDDPGNGQVFKKVNNRDYVMWVQKILD